MIDQTWDAFEAEFRRRWPERLDARLWGDEFLEERLAVWRSEAWLFAAAKMSRRIIGAAKTRDIESLPENLREGAARGVLWLARRLVVEREMDSRPQRLRELAAAALSEARTS